LEVCGDSLDHSPRFTSHVTAVEYIHDLVSVYNNYHNNILLFVNFNIYIYCKNCGFIAMCKAHSKVTPIKQQKNFHHLMLFMLLESAFHLLFCLKYPFKLVTFS